MVFYTTFILLRLVLAGSSVFAQNGSLPKNIKIGRFSTDLLGDESLAVDVFLYEQEDFKVVKLSLDQIGTGSYKKSGLTHIMSHKLSDKGHGPGCFYGDSSIIE